MTAIFLLRLALVSSCSDTLLHDHRKHLNNTKAFVARRTNHAHSSAGRQRHHKRLHIARSAIHLHKHRRTQSRIDPAILQLQYQKHLALHLGLADMDASNQHLRRRSSAADRTTLAAPVTPMTDLDAHLVACTSTPSLPPRPSQMTRSASELSRGSSSDMDAESMPPPPPPADDCCVGRSSRSTSNASRNAHRLSLTLPIALPTSDPSRPPSTILSSYPATPIDSALASPVDANDFIIAIATQERKVLELREELARAEEELLKLKKHWTTQEAHQKRNRGRHIEPLRPLGPQLNGGAPEDLSAARRSVDLDRRKAFLQSQNSPKEHRRRVMRGGHTRTLSLLSPAKTDGGFSVHEDSDGMTSPEIPPIAQPFVNPALSKRASWQPRSYHPNQQGVKQIAEDFKSGLWSFVEDIRQATVGDEPINGRSLRQSTQDAPTRKERPVSFAADQETIKASSSMRPRAGLDTAFDGPAAETPSRSSTSLERPLAKAKNKAKNFSWTPLSFDSIDDNDWSNWESPSVSSVKSTRWSGSTVSGGEGIASIPEKADENETPLKKKSSRAAMAIDTRVERSATPILSPTKLEEILPNVVNRLSPSNIKRTANILMDEWEKSLTPPPRERDTPVASKENHA